MTLPKSNTMIYIETESYTFKHYDIHTNTILPTATVSQREGGVTYDFYEKQHNGVHWNTIMNVQKL